MRRSRTARAVAAGCVLVTLSTVSACSVPWPKQDVQPSKVAADRTEITAIYDRYSTVRSSALALLDPTPLGTVESGPVLAIDTGAVRVAKLLATRQPAATTSDQQIERVLAPRLGAYPLWFVAIVRDDGRSLRTVQVFERERAVEQWRLVASPEVLLTTRLPKFATGGDGALEPLAPDARAGLDLSPQAAVDAYAATLADPNSPSADEVEQDKFIDQMRAVAVASGAIKGVAFVQRWGADPVDFALRTTDGGALVFATLLREDSYTVKSGVSVQWPKDSEQQAFLAGRLRTAGLLRYYHQVLMYVPSRGHGKPRVLGQYGGVVDGSGS